MPFPGLPVDCCWSPILVTLLTLALPSEVPLIHSTSLEKLLSAYIYDLWIMDPAMITEDNPEVFIKWGIKSNLVQSTFSHVLMFLTLCQLHWANNVHWLLPAAHWPHCLHFVMATESQPVAVPHRASSCYCARSE